MSETRRPAGQPVRHIVFDIGKVLIHYDPNIPFSRLIPDEAERNDFFANVCTHEWNLEQDRGRSWADAEALLIQQFPDKTDLIRAFRLHWHEMVSHAYDDSVDIMLDLIQQGRDVTMLTNFAADTFKEAQERFPFLKVPRGVWGYGIRQTKMVLPKTPAAFSPDQLMRGTTNEVALVLAGTMAVRANQEGELSVGQEKLRLDAPLVRDGLALAYGRIYASARNGRVYCINVE